MARKKSHEKNATMSTDSSVTKKLVETLEDAKNGYAKGAQALAGSNEPQLSSTFAKYAQQREAFAAELTHRAESYDDDAEESGSVAAAVHHGWMVGDRRTCSRRSRTTRSGLRLSGPAARTSTRPQR